MEIISNSSLGIINVVNRFILFLLQVSTQSLRLDLRVTGNVHSKYIYSLNTLNNNKII
jgi:hypothetical protein